MILVCQIFCVYVCMYMYYLAPATYYLTSVILIPDTCTLISASYTFSLPTIQKEKEVPPVCDIASGVVKRWIPLLAKVNAL